MISTHIDKLLIASNDILVHDIIVDEQLNVQPRVSGISPTWVYQMSIIVSFFSLILWRSALTLEAIMIYNVYVGVIIATYY